MERPTANLIINAKKTQNKKWNTFPPKLGTGKDVYLFLPLPLDIVLVVVLANSIGTYENKCTEAEKKVKKKYSFANDTLYVENPKESTKNYYNKQIQERSQDIRSIYKNQLHFYILAINNWEMKLRNHLYTFIIA